MPSRKCMPLLQTSVSVTVPRYARDSRWNLLAGREPQEHKSPLGVAFSVLDLSQEQLPAGRAPVIVS
jgi:hypothetical protein